MRQIRCPECEWRIEGLFPSDIQEYHQHYAHDHAPKPLIRDIQVKEN